MPTTFRPPRQNQDYLRMFLSDPLFTGGPLGIFEDNPELIDTVLQRLRSTLGDLGIELGGLLERGEGNSANFQKLAKLFDDLQGARQGIEKRIGKGVFADLSPENMERFPPTLPATDENFPVVQRMVRVAEDLLHEGGSSPLSGRLKTLK